mgnify:CR=1 FL=1
MVQVSPNDDHMAHLEMHAKANETGAKAAHIGGHKVAMRVQRNQPELFPQLLAEQQAQQENGKTKVTPSLGNLGGLLKAPSGNVSSPSVSQ